MSWNMCIHHLGLLMLCCGLGNKLVLPRYLLPTLNYHLQKFFFLSCFQESFTQCKHWQTFFFIYIYVPVFYSVYFILFWKVKCWVYCLFGVWGFLGWGFFFSYLADLELSSPSFLCCLILTKLSFLNWCFSPVNIFIIPLHHFIH